MGSSKDDEREKMRDWGRERGDGPSVLGSITGLLNSLRRFEGEDAE